MPSMLMERRLTAFLVDSQEAKDWSLVWSVVEKEICSQRDGQEMPNWCHFLHAPVTATRSLRCIWDKMDSRTSKPRSLIPEELIPSSCPIDVGLSCILVC